MEHEGSGVRGVLLGRLRLYPLADESMGVRSMALGVETPDVRILLDAGVSLAPRRYGLPPHPEEFRAAREARERILEFAKRSDVVTISHYHLDHYTPSFTSFYEWSSREAFEAIYAGKLLLIKRPDETVSFNQRRRARAFLRDLEGLGCEVLEADGRVVELGSTRIRALGPYPHGSGGRLGSVLAFMVEYGDVRLVYAPDLQGPVSSEGAEELAQLRPTLLVMGGPPTYLAGIKVEASAVEAGLDNLSALAKRVAVVVSHHLLRDAGWRERLRSRGVARVATYAQLAGVEERLLESMRRELHSERPPSPEFTRWLERYRKGVREPPPI